MEHQTSGIFIVNVKRAFALTIIALLLNFLAAISCLLYSNPNTSEKKVCIDWDSKSGWVIESRRSIGAVQIKVLQMPHMHRPVVVSDQNCSVPRWTGIDPDISPFDGCCDVECHVEARGWPLVSIKGRMCTVGLYDRSDCNCGGLTQGPSLFGAMKVSPASASRRGSPFLPYAPIWSNVAVNVLVFVACVFLADRVIRSIRQHYRTRRNLCAKCGYSLSGSVGDRCPECGVAVRVHKGVGCKYSATGKERR